MLEIYHNPMCSKSREALAYLEEKEAEFKVIKYMDEEITPDLLRDLLDKLNLDAIDIIRTNEQVWKDEFEGKELEEEELLLAMTEYPELIQRPIVVNGDKAVLARPVGGIDGLL